jgi:DNA-binding Xre family transcriptional regulator
VAIMSVSYKKLWKLLIDKDMKKRDLVELANVSTYTIGRMTRGENITTEVLEKICKSLNCDFEDIMELIDD